MAEYLIQGTTLTALADEIRVLSGSEENMGTSTMVSNMSAANTEIESQESLIERITNALDGKVDVNGDGSVNLPSLSNPAAAEEIFLDKEVIDAYGNIKTGTFTIESELSEQDELLAELEELVKTKANGGTGVDDVFKDVIERTTTEINNNSISSIGNYAFYSYSNLALASFPICTNIGSSAFYNCYSLITANFPACISIGDCAFGNCSSLTSINFPVCTTISEEAFYGCSLRTASFPACTTIGSFAFGQCSLLTTAFFPVCTTINNNAFRYCDRLTSISFPVCTSIGNYAFYSCYSLTTVSFPACTNIGISAFYNCSYLTSISFPA